MKAGDMIYAVLYEYSPDGKRDFCADIPDRTAYLAKEEACAAVRSKYEELLDMERSRGSQLDVEWGEALGDEDMRKMGYSWKDDFSELGFCPAESYPDSETEPGFRWRVVELAAGERATAA